MFLLNPISIIKIFLLMLVIVCIPHTDPSGCSPVIMAILGPDCKHTFFTLINKLLSNVATVTALRASG